MSENINNTENIDTTSEQTVVTQTETRGDKKTFTQENVNKIVQERLAKERQKFSEEMSKKEQELAKREFRVNSRQKLIDRGYNEEILDVLNCNDEASLDRALNMIDNLVENRIFETSKARAFRPEEIKLIEELRKAKEQDPKGKDIKIFGASSFGSSKVFSNRTDDIRVAMGLLD